MDISPEVNRDGFCFLFSFQSVKRVIGVEIIENAVEDAKANAQLNGGSCFEEIIGLRRW